ncbi:ester cyclase [Nocardia jejuensis]|nr:ester cyclase [Nocardia jejuensis]
MGIAPTGRPATPRGGTIVRDGTITERCGRLDELGLMQQLGIVPVPQR